MGTGGVVVRYVAVEDEGEDEGGWAIADNDGVDMGWNRPEEHVTRMGGAWTSSRRKMTCHDALCRIKAFKGEESRLVRYK